MAKKRTTHTPQFKAKVALEAAREQYTISELARKYSLHPNVIRGWKQQLVEHLPEIFQRPGSSSQKEDEAEVIPQLYQQIGRLQVELEWLKKNTNRSVTERRAMIETSHDHLSVARQCELLGLSRSSFYYRPLEADPFRLEIMHAIDRIYTQYPFYGVRRIQQALRREGYAVNHKRVHRLMQVMGLQAIYPRRSLSAGGEAHRVYPYLLGDREIDRPDRVWASDITYLPLLHGFVYLVAVMDWFRRYVLSWRIANPLDAAFCLEALEEALAQGRPEIFNTDQGSQFTSADFTQRVEGAGGRMSMDGRGRCMDNVFMFLPCL